MMKMIAVNHGAIRAGEVHSPRFGAEMLMSPIGRITKVVDVTDHASGTDPYYQGAKK